MTSAANCINILTTTTNQTVFIRSYSNLLTICTWAGNRVFAVTGSLTSVRLYVRGLFVIKSLRKLCDGGVGPRPLDWQIADTNGADNHMYQNTHHLSTLY